MARKQFSIRFPVSIRRKLEDRFYQYGTLSNILNMALSSYWPMKEETFDFKKYGNTKGVNLRIAQINHSQLKNMSEKTGIPMSRIIIRACEVALEAKNGK